MIHTNDRNIEILNIIITDMSIVKYDKYLHFEPPY